MGDTETSKAGGPIEEELARLPEADRAQVIAAFDASRSFRYAWADRYKAADLALRALGATRVPPGRRRRDTLYKMRCGCGIKLDYARPWLFWRCGQHPPSPLRTAEFGRIAKRGVRGVATVFVVGTVIASGVATLASILPLISGELRPVELRVLVWYWLLFASAMAWLLWRRRSERGDERE